MPRKKGPVEEQFTLVASIQAMERSYSILAWSEHRRLDDEAILTLTGIIEQISRRYERHNGKQIDIQLLCARSFSRDHASPTVDKPFLMSVGLRGDRPSLGAYLPSDAFWALPEMITSKAVIHVEAVFGPTRAGFGELLSLLFAPAKGLIAI